MVPKSDYTEKLLFVSQQRHTGFNGEISIDINRRFYVEEFSQRRVSSPTAGTTWSIEILDVHIRKTADFVSHYKVGRFHLRLPEQKNRGPPPRICFL